MTQSEWAAEPGESAPPPIEHEVPTAIDLDAIERDLRDVESALARLADGTYFAPPGASVPGTDAPGSPAADTIGDTVVDGVVNTVVDG